MTDAIDRLVEKTAGMSHSEREEYIAAHFPDAEREARAARSCLHGVERDGDDRIVSRDRPEGHSGAHSRGEADDRVGLEVERIDFDPVAAEPELRRTVVPEGEDEPADLERTQIVEVLAALAVVTRALSARGTFPISVTADGLWSKGGPNVSVHSMSGEFYTWSEALGFGDEELQVGPGVSGDARVSVERGRLRLFCLGPPPWEEANGD